MASETKKPCECRCPCEDGDTTHLTTPPTTPSGTTSLRGDVNPSGPTVTAEQVVSLDGPVLLDAGGIRRPVAATSRTTMLRTGGIGGDDFVYPEDLFLRGLGATAGGLLASGGGMVWRPGAMKRQGAAGGWFAPVPPPVLGAATGSSGRSERGDGRTAGPVGQYHRTKLSEEQEKRIRAEAQISESERETIAKKAALSPSGKAAVGSAKATHARFDSAAAAGQHALEEGRKRVQSDMSAAGISSDVLHGPGATANSLFTTRDPGDGAALGGGEIDVQSQKSSEAYVQAGRSAAETFQPTAKSALQAKRQAEERAKRMTQGAASDPGVPSATAQPGLSTIRARSGDEPSPPEVPRQPGASAGAGDAPASTIAARTTPTGPAPAPSARAPAVLAGGRSDTIFATRTPVSTTNSNGVLSVSGAQDPPPLSLAMPQTGTAIDIGSFGTGDAVVQAGGGGARVVEERSESDYAVSSFGGNALEGRLAAAAGMTRPTKGASYTSGVASIAADFVGAAAGAASALRNYGGGEWMDKLPLVGGAESVTDVLVDSDVVRGLGEKREAAMAAVRGWIQQQAYSGNEPGGRAYARARKLMASTMANAIRQALIAKWKKGGKKGPKPSTDDAREIAEALLADAEAGDAYVEVPPVSDGSRGPTVSSEGTCAEEARKCRERCGCKCVCTPIEMGGAGGDDDVLTLDGSVRGMRLDAEPMMIAGPPGPFDSGRMTVADPDEPDLESMATLVGIHAMIPMSSVIRRVKRIDHLYRRLGGTTARHKRERIRRQIARLEGEVEEALADSRETFNDGVESRFSEEMSANGSTAEEIAEFLAANEERFVALYYLQIAMQRTSYSLHREKRHRMRTVLLLKLGETQLSSHLLMFELRKSAGLPSANDAVQLILYAGHLDDMLATHNGGDDSARQWLGLLAHHPDVRDTLRDVDPSLYGSLSGGLADTLDDPFAFIGGNVLGTAIENVGTRLWNAGDRDAARRAAGVSKADIAAAQELLLRSDVRAGIAGVEQAIADMKEWTASKSWAQLGVYVAGAVAIGLLTGGMAYGLAAAAGAGTAATAIGTIGAVALASATAGLVGGALESVLRQSVLDGNFELGAIDLREVASDALIGAAFGAVTGPFSGTLRGATPATFRQSLVNKATTLRSLPIRVASSAKRVTASTIDNASAWIDELARGGIGARGGDSVMHAGAAAHGMPEAIHVTNAEYKRAIESGVYFAGHRRELIKGPWRVWAFDPRRLARTPWLRRLQMVSQGARRLEARVEILSAAALERPPNPWRRMGGTLRSRGPGLLDRETGEFFPNLTIRNGKVEQMTFGELTRYELHEYALTSLWAVPVGTALGGLGTWAWFEYQDHMDKRRATPLVERR